MKTSFELFLSWVSKTPFASRYLINNTHLTGSYVICVPKIVAFELFRNVLTATYEVGTTWIAGQHFHGTDKPDQHERSAQQDHAEVVHGDDDAQGADAEGDNRECAVESFCQDHAHAPTWGMILGQARTRVFRQQNRPGSAQGGVSGSGLCQNEWLMSHEQNVPETAAKRQSLLGMVGSAAIRLYEGHATRSRRGEIETPLHGYASPSGDGSLSTHLMTVAVKSTKQSMVVLGLILSLSCAAVAQEQSPKQNAQDAAGVASELMETTIKDSVNLEEIVPGFETADPDDLSQHYEDKGASLEGATQDALNDLDSRAGEAGSLIVDTYATRPEQSVTRTESFLATARGALETPESLTSGIFSVNQAPNCEPTEVNAVQPGIRSCDIYSEVDELECALGTIVEVDAEKTYRCERETASYLKTCPETLQVQCTEPVSNCRLEDGLLITAFPDLQLLDVNGLHRLEITGIDGFNGGATDITRRARLIITDLSKVTSFRLSNVHYRSFLNLRLNGALIYSGPGGDGASPFVLGEYEHPVDKADYIFGVGQNGVFLTRGVGIPPTTEVVGIDLLDQLIEGENIIEFDLIVTATENGRASLEFTILLSCCANWDSEWVRQCP